MWHVSSHSSVVLVAQTAIRFLTLPYLTFNVHFVFPAHLSTHSAPSFLAHIRYVRGCKWEPIWCWLSQSPWQQVQDSVAMTKQSKHEILVAFFMSKQGVSGRCLVCKHGSHVTGIPTLSSKTTRYTRRQWPNNRSQTLVGSGRLWKTPLLCNTRAKLPSLFAARETGRGKNLSRWCDIQSAALVESSPYNLVHEVNDMHMHLLQCRCVARSRAIIVLFIKKKNAPCRAFLQSNWMNWSRQWRINPFWSVLQNLPTLNDRSNRHSLVYNTGTV